MALLPNINVGSAANDGTGDSIRDAFVIVNENFQLIEAFFPNSDVANLTANITSTGTSIFNIANVDVLNVNTVSTFTASNITVTGTSTFDTINVDVINANTISNLTVEGNISVNVTSTGNSTFNNLTSTGISTFGTTDFTGNSTFAANLIADIMYANIGSLDLINASNVVASANITAGNLIISGSTDTASLTVSDLTVNQDAAVTGNITSGGAFNIISPQSGILLVSGTLSANGRLRANAHTITSDANLEASPIYAQTIVANLTAGNITVTLPNASVPYSKGTWYTFICYDEGGLSNRTLTINVQPSAGNIWTSANTQNTFVNVGAELGTNSVNLKTNEVYWFTN